MPSIMTEKQMVISALNNHLGLDLAKLAKQHDITPYINGKQNKGWKGITLERLAGLSNDTRQAPDGLTYELKSTAFYQVKGLWVPKETTAITMINPQKLVSTPFYESHCWIKLKSLIYCAVTWYGRNEPKAELLKIAEFSFNPNDKIVREIEADYELIRKKAKSGGFESLTSKYGTWIQARTKGAGHGSTSRAFYAKKELIKQIIQI